MPTPIASPVPPLRARALYGVCAVGIAFLIGLLAAWWGAALAHFSPWKVSSWIRWDSFHYREIAMLGYDLHRCTPKDQMPPHWWCGNSGWFPGLPYLMRLGPLLGIAATTFGVLCMWGAHLVTLAVLWFGWLWRLPRLSAWSALLLAALFPGSVYYRALFPISLVTASGMTALLLLARGRPLLGGIAAMLAVVSYPSGVLFAAAVLVPLLGSRPWSAGVRQTLWFLAPIALAEVAVMIEFQRVTGHWNAWFLIQSKYGYGNIVEWQALLQRFRPLLQDSGNERWIALQTWAAAALMLAMTLGMLARWRATSRLDRMSAVVALVYWLFPLLMGGYLSITRAESLLLPAAVVVGRVLPKWLVAAFVPVLLFVAVVISRLFFATVIV